MAGYTALQAAAANNHIDVVYTLMNVGAAFDTKENLCRTALHLAANNGHLEMCQILIAAGAQPLVEDKRFKKPHELARQNKHWPVVDFLMDPYGGIRLP